jgi:hypothetical protein
MRECCWGREGRHRGVFVVLRCVWYCKRRGFKKTCSEHFTHATISVVTGTFTAVPVYTNKYSNQLSLKVNVPESQTLLL